MIDIEDPAAPKQVHLNTSCTTSQGDLIVYKNLLIRSWDSPTSAAGAATQSAGGQLVGQGFEGIHIFDITNPANPVFVRGTALHHQDVPRQGCGSARPPRCRDKMRAATCLHLQRRSSGTCMWMDVLKINTTNETVDLVNSVATDGAAGASVPATLALTMGAPASSACSRRASQGSTRPPRRPP